MNNRNQVEFISELKRFGIEITNKDKVTNQLTEKEWRDTFVKFACCGRGHGVIYKATEDFDYQKAVNMLQTFEFEKDQIDQLLNNIRPLS